MSSDVDLAGKAALRARRVKRARRRQAQALSPEILEQRRRETSAVVRRAIVAMFVTIFILLLFNSDGLRSYARDLPESDFADRVVLTADWWHGWMEQVGASRPKAFVRQLMQALRDA